MKKYSKILIFVILAVFCLTVTSCGKDDDDDISPAISSKSFVGTWVEGTNRRWVFNSNGTCEFYTSKFSGDPRKPTLTWVKQKNGTWSYKAETNILFTNVYNWNWYILNVERDSWSG